MLDAGPCEGPASAVGPSTPAARVMRVGSQRVALSGRPSLGSDSLTASELIAPVLTERCTQRSIGL